MIVDVLAITPNAEKVIEEAGRTCYQSKGRIKEGSAADFIKRVIKSGHGSVMEHAYVTIRLKEVSRAFTHQLVRHRLCSFSQQSQRYVREDNFSYKIPPKIEVKKEAKEIFVKCMENMRKAYKKILDMDVPKEDARYVLPNATHTEIIFSCNFRELRHIIALRGGAAAQWEIRECCIKILEKMKEIIPCCFFDLEIDHEKRIIESE